MNDLFLVSDYFFCFFVEGVTAADVLGLFSVPILLIALKCVL